MAKMNFQLSVSHPSEIILKYANLELKKHVLLSMLNTVVMHNIIVEMSYCLDFFDE